MGEIKILAEIELDKDYLRPELIKSYVDVLAWLHFLQHVIKDALNIGLGPRGKVTNMWYPYLNEGKGLCDAPMFFTQYDKKEISK